MRDIGPDIGFAKPPMKRLFVLWALGVVVVASWAFAPAPAPPQIPEVNRGKAFGANENIMVDIRVQQRLGAFTTLELPWASRCEGKTRERFIGGLNNYYYSRQNELRHYAEYFGQLGADYIAKQWSTTDDQRIDRLTQDAYARGYLKPADFKGPAATLIATVLKDERVTGNACAG
jgi:hypothetical protein